MAHNDPFFQKQKERLGYVESIHRTYGKVPPRSSDTYEKALEFRNKEKQHFQELEDNYRELVSHSEWRDHLAGVLVMRLQETTDKLSKLEAEHERATTRRDDRTADGGVRVQPEQLEQPREERPLHGQVLPADGVPDPRGQASEHGDEGRRTGGDDTAGSVEQRDEAVPEGGD